jgi:hypothetical protein
VIRRILIAVLAALFAVTVLSWGVSYWRMHGVQNLRHLGAWWLFSENGVIGYERSYERLGPPNRTTTPSPFWERATGRRYPAYLSWFEAPHVWRASVPWYLPTAIVGGLLAAASSWPKRRPPGTCRCGYDLTGNVSGTCPECGRRMGIVKRGEPGG